jgi:hypothetical protein
VAGGADQPLKISRTCGFLRADGISAGSAFGRDGRRNLSSARLMRVFHLQEVTYNVPR